MASVQVDLPDEMYRQLKQHDIYPSELLQKALLGELRRREVLQETERYPEQQFRELGQPTDDEISYSSRVLREIKTALATQANPRR